MDTHPDGTGLAGGAEQALTVSASDPSALWPLLAVTLIVAGHAMVRVSKTVWQLGFDPRRSLAHRGRTARALGFVVLLGAAISRMLYGLPLLYALGAVVGVVLLLASTGTLHDVLGGAYAQLRLRLREGDHLSVGEHEGEVHSLHWEHVALRGAEGRAIHVPNRLLLRSAVAIRSERNVEQLVSRLPLMAGALDVHGLRDALSVSPYRAPGTPLSIASSEGHVEVQWYVWSREARASATRHLESLLARHTSPATPSS